MLVVGRCRDIAQTVQNFFSQLGKMLATFHWERGHLLWERLRLPEAQTV